jgi:hypothetical protein
MQSERAAAWPRVRCRRAGQGAPPAALISYRFWQRYLGGTADFASRSLRIGDRASAIVGVMPPGFDYPEGADVWTPLELDRPISSRTGHNYRGIARLAPGVSSSTRPARTRTRSRIG